MIKSALLHAQWEEASLGDAGPGLLMGSRGMGDGGSLGVPSRPGTAMGCGTQAAASRLPLCMARPVHGPCHADVWLGGCWRSGHHPFIARVKRRTF